MQLPLIPERNLEQFLILLLNQKLINPPSLLIHHEMKILQNPNIQAVILETVTGLSWIQVVIVEVAVALEILVDQVDQVAEDHQEEICQSEVRDLENKQYWISWLKWVLV